MSQVLIGDHAKWIKLQKNEALLDFSSYTNVKLRISDNKGNLIQKYSLVTTVGYKPLTLTGTTQLNYSIFREDIDSLSPKSDLTVEVLLITDNTDHKDDIFIDPWRFTIGPVSKMLPDTITDEY